ncbi:hypothetical protein [Streptomyces sp. NPDC002044]|uniref:P-type ATPase n=1 Tax=Streptomyces sp. NPDC002044 TaxID=3154662 RepID=UPI003327945D
MLVAAAGAASIGPWEEGAVLLVLFSLGHALEGYAMDRARRSIEALGALDVVVTRLARDNTLARVVRLVRDADQRTSPTQRFTDRFQKVFVPGVLVLVLVKGGAPLEEFGRLRTLAFDKTGILTEGRPRLTEIEPAAGAGREELPRTAVARAAPQRPPARPGRRTGRGAPRHRRPAARGRRPAGGHRPRRLSARTSGWPTRWAARSAWTRSAAA